MKAITILLIAVGTLMAGNATAQLLRGLPQAGAALRPLGNVLGPVSDTIGSSVAVLAQSRLDRIAASIRAYPNRIALDPDGFAARRGEVIVADPDDMLIAAAKARDLRLLDRGETLGIAYARFALPDGTSLKAGIALLRKLGASDVSADQLYTQSGASRASAQPITGNGVRIGMIDGGVAGTAATQRGFATGAPRASEHGTAIASLITGSKHVKGAAPGAQLFAADIYGNDPAGGSAFVMVQALGWLVSERVPVVIISLVGPPNALLARVVAAAQARGTVIVAAVGNDGSASPPSYPASYPGVIAVTAIDGRKRVLIEAGHATRLDYAAPGADMVAASLKGDNTPVRGTSFAAPLVAATIALAYPVADPSRRAVAIASVDNAAERRDKRYGRGIVCGRCATTAK